MVRASNVRHNGKPPSVIEDLVLDVIADTLGDEYAFRHSRLPGPNVIILGTHLQVYNTLGTILPFTPHSKFWWNKLGRPFGSMLDTAHYSPTAQCRFLCFFYGSVIPLMAPHNRPRSGSMMTIDGSPVELSWVLPQRLENVTGPQNTCRHREVRFAIEPMHPISGRRLKGSAVLDYLTSPSGSLGMVVTGEDGMAWRKKTELFLFPDADDDSGEIPDGSRFFVGFDFDVNGTVSLKAYYLPAPSPNLEKSFSPYRTQSERPLVLWDVDYDPLRRLVSDLDPALMEPLELLLSYFESLDDLHKPRIQILAVDCLPSRKNRLKIYCRPKEGASWSDAVRSFTLGGRLQSPEMDNAVAHMRGLWNNLFPGATSDMDCDLGRRSHLWEDCGEEKAVSDGNGIKLNEAKHPVGGLLYYYSVFAGKDSVYPKIYLPVTQYCRNDLEISRAIERFLSETRDADQARFPPDWVANEVATAFNHRDLGERTGTHTYVTFAFKKRGWEVTNYFSPEV